MDLTNERFLQAVDIVITEARERDGIGRLGEKLIHASLKLFYDNDRTHHEVKVKKKIADIFDGETITEIQTGPFTPLKTKLAVFLPVCPVTVVHPIPNRKTVVWIDENGEFSKPSRSPKKADVFSVFQKIISVAEFLTHPNLTIKIVLLDVEEYRLLHPKYGKRRSTRYERVPKAFISEIPLQSKEDYAALLPKDLPASFTQSEFSKLLKIRGRTLWAVLKVFQLLGIFKREKVGREYRYQRV